MFLLVYSNLCSLFLPFNLSFLFFSLPYFTHFLSLSLFLPTIVFCYFHYVSSFVLSLFYPPIPLKAKDLLSKEVFEESEKMLSLTISLFH
jgi:hypothetical protein